MCIRDYEQYLHRLFFGGKAVAFLYHSFVFAGLENFALAQHCFIKSIEVEQNVRIPYLSR